MRATSEVVIKAEHSWNEPASCCSRVDLPHHLCRWHMAGQEAPVCGPSGQDAARFDARRLLGQGKRVIRGRWMELIGHVAHPRRWDPAQTSGWDLLYYLVFRDPKELTRTLIPLGRHLTTPGSAVDLQIDALSGGSTATPTTAAVLREQQRQCQAVDPAAEIEPASDVRGTSSRSTASSRIQSSNRWICRPLQRFSIVCSVRL